MLDVVLLLPVVVVPLVIGLMVLERDVVGTEEGCIIRLTPVLWDDEVAGVLLEDDGGMRRCCCCCCALCA